MARWCKGYCCGAYQRGRGLLYKCAGGAISAVLCVVLCWVIARKTFLPLFDIYRCIDSRRLRRNLRVGLPFGGKHMLIIGAGRDEQRTPCRPAEDKTPLYGR